MKTFNESQMYDPWWWCQDVIAKHDISSKMMHDATGIPRSTLRALYNKTNDAPRYGHLQRLIAVCIMLENGHSWDEVRHHPAEYDLFPGRDKSPDMENPPPIEPDEDELQSTATQTVDIESFL